MLPAVPPPGPLAAPPAPPILADGLVAGSQASAAPAAGAAVPGRLRSGQPGAGVPAVALPLKLRPLVESLQRHGFRVLLVPPPNRRSYGEFVAGTRTLWIAPLSFELGIGTQVLLHEAAHAVQSCPHGVLTPVGWKLPLAPVVSREISGILLNNYQHGNHVLEQEAFALQGQPDAIPRLLKALSRRCR